MKITVRKLRRLLGNAYDAGVFAGFNCERQRDINSLRKDYVQEEIEMVCWEKRKALATQKKR